jgi:hypothetical protein
MIECFPPMKEFMMIASDASINFFITHACRLKSAEEPKRILPVCIVNEYYAISVRRGLLIGRAGRNE